MDSVVEYLKGASTTVQALGVTAGGLIGVFATLTVFGVIIWLSVKLGGARES